MNDVTLVITTCDRNKLLKKTLESFFKHNTYPIKKALIIEDSGKDVDFSDIEPLIKCDYEIIKNETNIGQWASIDKVYSMVETEWIFHCEEDWLFIDSGFIEKSFEVFEACDKRNIKLFTVWGDNLKLKDGKRLLKKIDNFHLLNPHIVLGGYTLNPGLRRMSDQRKFSPYKQYETNGVDREVFMAGKYINDGYYSAYIDDTHFWYHIGYDDHIERDLSR